MAEGIESGFYEDSKTLNVRVFAYEAGWKLMVCQVRMFHDVDVQA